MYINLFSKAFRLMSIFSISLIAGLMAVFLPAKLLFALVFVVVLFVVVLFNPWMVVVITLGFVSGLDLPGFFPQLGLGGGKIKISDVFLLASVAFLILFFWRDFKENIKSIEPVRLLFLYYFVFVLLSCLIGYLFFETGLKSIFGELRHQLYWVLLPVFAVLVVENARYKKIIIFLVLLGIVASVLQLVQALGGIQVSDKARALTTMGDVSEVVRTSIAIFIIAWALFLVSATHLFGFIKFSSFIPLFLIFALALLVTYTKSFWAGFFLGFIVLLMRFKLNTQAFTVVKLGALALIMLFALGLIKPQIISSVVDRVSVIGDELESGYSLYWRLFENEKALESIKQYPLGIGIGSAYRETTIVDLNVADMTRYIHNSYLYVLVKLGVLASVVLFLVLYRLIMYSNFCYKHAKNNEAISLCEKIDLIVFTTYIPLMLGVLVYSVFTPILMTDGGIAFIAAISGIMLGRGWKLRLIYK